MDSRVDTIQKILAAVVEYFNLRSSYFSTEDNHRDTVIDGHFDLVELSIQIEAAIHAQRTT